MPTIKSQESKIKVEASEQFKFKLYLKTKNQKSDNQESIIQSPHSRTKDQKIKNRRSKQQKTRVEHQKSKAEKQKKTKSENQKIEIKRILSLVEVWISFSCLLFPWRAVVFFRHGRAAVY